MVARTQPHPPITFASDACIVEPVDEHDRPEPIGQPSSAVLITKLFNPTQTVIRYRLEDRLLVHPPLPGIGYLRADVEGRTTDVLHYPGADIHPLVLNSPLDRNPAIADRLVRQTSDGVDVEVLADDTLDTDPRRRAPAGTPRPGLADPHVTIRTVTAIARDPATGKRLRIVPIEPVTQRCGEGLTRRVRLPTTGVTDSATGDTGTKVPVAITV